MEQTVSGNGITDAGETQDTLTGETEGLSVTREGISGNIQEAAVSAASTDSAQETADGSEICSLLGQLAAGTEEQNGLLGSILGELRDIRESLSALSGTAEETGAGDTDTEVETETETPAGMPADMEALLSGIRDTCADIGATVSGNSVYLDGISGAVQGLSESYTGAVETQHYTYTYSLAFGAGILFVAACIAGLHIARLVWGRMG